MPAEIPPFVKQVDPQVAKEEISDFRVNFNPTQSYGVFYTQKQIYDYIKPGGTFDDLTRNKPIPAGSNEWVVGFYFRKTVVNNQNYLTFCVAPIAHDSNNKLVLDRFDNKQYQYESPVNGISEFKIVGGSDIYDDGNMFP